MTDPEKAGTEPLCFLVLPFWAVHPFTGAGQRSAILFSALKRLGPTVVLILGDEDLPHAADFFPGATEVRWVKDGGIFAGGTGMRGRLARSVFLSRTYRPAPGLTAVLRTILGAGDLARPRVVAYRYFRPFCVSGVTEVSGVAVHSFVDIDDRDDQRLMSSLAQAKLPMKPAALAAARAIFVPWLRRIMARRLQAADLVWFAAAEDCGGFAHLPHLVVENVPISNEAVEGLPPPSAGHDVLFVGSHGHHPNVSGVRWFLNECWPAILAAHPWARFRIVGSGAWNRLGQEFPCLANVDIVGRVDLLAPEYGRARLVVSPIFEGGGSKIKLIEACAYGRPVVAISHSARGFGDRIAGRIAQAGGVAGFVGECLRYLDDPAQADGDGTALRALQQAEFSREATEERISSVIRQQLKG